MNESGLTMVFHSAIIGLIIYAIMIFNNTEQEKAENRSVLIAGIALIYMVIFGHKTPSINNINTKL